MISLYVLLAVTLFAATSLFYSGWRNGITPMPSSRKAKDALVRATVEELRLIRTNPAVVVEAGSGWGGVALDLASRLPQARVHGYENSLLPYLISRLRAQLAAYSNLHLHFGDYRRARLASSDILVCYLFPGGMQDIARLIHQPVVKLQDRTNRSLPVEHTGPVIISNTFALPDRTPERRIQSGDTSLSIIYVYRPDQLREPSIRPPHG